MARNYDRSAEKMLADKGLDLQAGRRAFLQGMGVGAAGVAASGLALASTSANAETKAQRLDVEILTFALNLEYLEATFYLLAATGSGLSAADRGDNPGTVIGGSKATLSPLVNAYAQELAIEEQTHVRFLRSALVAANMVPISAPNIDLSNSFTAAAQAAGLVPPGTAFNPFTSGDVGFLLASYIFEDVGVTAYHGALTSISNKTYLDKASGIMATEAYHAGIVRTALFALGNQADSTNAISVLRQKLTGSNGVSAGFGTPTQGNDHGVGTLSAPTILDADGDAIAWERTVPQVLNVVYADTTLMQKPGGFFPNGVNAAH